MGKNDFAFQDKLSHSEYFLKSMDATQLSSYYIVVEMEMKNISFIYFKYDRYKL